MTAQDNRIKVKSGLYVTATPIGNLSDLSPRAEAVLRSVAAIACEDTRVTKKLLSRFGIDTPCFPYHDHNAASVRPQILRRIEAGEAIALVSDAGTPLISDPGYKLVAELQDLGHLVVAIPGPAAPMAAVMVAGLPSDRILFDGFLPNKQAARQTALDELRTIAATLIFFESPKRVAASLKDMATVLGPSRQAAVCRELTKVYEEVVRGSLQELADHYAAADTPKGEIVVVVGPPDAASLAGEGDVDAALLKALKTLSTKEAAAAVALETGQPRKKLYQRALELKQTAGTGDD